MDCYQYESMADGKLLRIDHETHEISFWVRVAESTAVAPTGLVSDITVRRR